MKTGDKSRKTASFLVTTEPHAGIGSPVEQEGKARRHRQACCDSQQPPEGRLLIWCEHMIHTSDNKTGVAGDGSGARSQKTAAERRGRVVKLDMYSEGV